MLPTRGDRVQLQRVISALAPPSPDHEDVLDLRAVEALSKLCEARQRRQARQRGQQACTGLHPDQAANSSVCSCWRGQATEVSEAAAGGVAVIRQSEDACEMQTLEAIR